MSKQFCRCTKQNHIAKMIVITGGPGGGKTAILEAAKRIFCPHVVILPEAATILFKGGFFRLRTDEGRKAAQRAIFCVQKELEHIAIQQGQACLILCDRGTVDGLGYWPGQDGEFWRDVAAKQEDEYARYFKVIHLRTPDIDLGYNHQNPMRIETPEEAALIDDKILKAWQGHPNRHIIESKANFFEKMNQVTQLIREEVPACCQS
ncbi:MAG: ATP-binding protein [Bdellovibrionales bacterium]